jgi:Sulfatase
MDRSVMERRQRPAPLVVAWTVMAATNVLAALLTVRTNAMSDRLVLHAYDVGQMLSLGLVSALLVVGWARWGPTRRVWAYVALAVASIGLGQLVLRADLIGLATLFGAAAEAMSYLLVALFATCIPAAAWLSLRLSQSRWRWVLALAAVAIGFGHQLALPNLYPAIHAYGTWFGATLLAGALNEPGADVERWWQARPAALRYALIAVAVVGGGFVVLVPPSVRVQSLLSMVPGAVVERYRPTLWVDDATARGSGQWFEDRSKLADIPASGVRLVDGPPIVLLVVFDALRADVLTGKDAPHLPTLKRLMDAGVHFENAWTPAPGTRETVSAIFAGKYTSQLHWERPSDQKRVFPKDDAVRLPELLEAAGVNTAVVKGLRGLVPELGLTKGMGTVVSAKSQKAKPMVDHWLKWHAKHSTEPVFGYLHFIEAHQPYNLGGTKGTPYERYLAELAIADAALAALVRGFEARGLMERTLFILTADHGEAFGEHNSRYHGATVFEEVVRVPLVVSNPTLAAKTMVQKVTLMDLAPTVLDVFGVDTPGSYMGQSLLPLLSGSSDPLTRPIFIDSQSKTTAMVFDDWMKIIVRNKVPALYDLRADPKELHNIYDERDDAAERLATMRQFIKAHRMKQRGRL